jgi:hypothetical protein
MPSREAICGGSVVGSLEKGKDAGMQDREEGATCQLETVKGEPSPIVTAPSRFPFGKSNLLEYSVRPAQ